MILLISLSFITMTFFCLAMPKHRIQILPQKTDVKISLLFRPLAWLLLILTCYISVEYYGGSIGPTVFIGVLIAALVPLIFVLTYRPKMLPILSIALAGISLVNFVN